MRKLLLVAAAMTALNALPFIAGASQNAVASEIHVVDGDTLDLGGVRYRLNGIDAPEAGQKCARAGGGTWTCGKAATAALEDLALGQDVVCDNRGSDDYGRIIAVCVAGGVELNSTMIEKGLAWAFRKYSLDYVEQENKARLAHLGVWQADTQTPWDYRAMRWESAQQQAPDGCPIKGNISDSGKIYHAPWSPWYDRTVVSVDKGERWFCDEAEAIAAGWRAPRWGR